MNFVQATDIVLGQFKEAWDPTGLPVEWPNEQAPAGTKLADGTEDYASATLQLVDAMQTTLAPTGMRRFTREGICTIQVFARAGERGLERVQELCMTALNAFEGKNVGGVRFVRVSPKDVGLDGAWYQMNVIAVFEFEEVK